MLVQGLWVWFQNIQMPTTLQKSCQLEIPYVILSKLNPIKTIINNQFTRKKCINFVLKTSSKFIVDFYHMKELLKHQDCCSFKNLSEEWRAGNLKWLTVWFSKKQRIFSFNLFSTKYCDFFLSFHPEGNLAAELGLGSNWMNTLLELRRPKESIQLNSASSFSLKPKAEVAM